MEEPGRMRRVARCAPFLGLFGGRYALWLASDHLIHVTNTGYSERVRRFYLGDIESVSLVRTRAGTLTLALSLLFLAVSAVSFAFPGPLPVFLALIVWPVAALSGFAAARSLIFGPTSACVLHTAVQQEELRALGRHRRALVVLGELAPMIVGAQGGPMLPEELTDPPKMEALEPARHRVVPGGVPADEASSAPMRSAVWHTVSFGLMMLFSASLAADAFFPRHWKDMTDTVLLLAVVVVSIFALGRQARALTVPWLKQALAAQLVFLVVVVVFALPFFSVFSLGLQQGLNQGLEAQLLARQTQMPLQVFSLATGLVGLLLASVGLMLAQDHASWVRKRAAGGASPGTPPAAGTGADDDHTAQ